MNSLGHPSEGALPCWIIEVEWDGKTIPIAFSPEQANEIARRIVSYYKLTDDDLA